MKRGLKWKIAERARAERARAERARAEQPEAQGQQAQEWQPEERRPEAQEQQPEAQRPEAQEEQAQAADDSHDAKRMRTDEPGSRGGGAPASGEALGRYVGSKASKELRFAQRMLFLSGNGRDVEEFEYKVSVVVAEAPAKHATISMMGLACTVELRPIGLRSSDKTELGIGAEDVRAAVCRMLGVSREEFDTALELQGFGNNGANVLIKEGLLESGKEMKYNKPRYTRRTLSLRRCAMCDLCGRVNLETAYTVKVEDAPASWPCAKKLGLKVCGTKSCSGKADVLWVRGEYVRIDKDSHWHKATGSVMGRAPPMPPT